MERLGECSKCPLCEGPSDFLQEQDFIYLVGCSRCGRFKMTLEASQVLRPEDKPLLSAYCRRQSESVAVPLIKRDTIRPFIDSLPKFTVPEKLDNMLELIAQMSPTEFGSPTGFEARRDYPLLVMRNAREAMWYEQELHNRSYLVSQASNLPSAVSMRGWERLEEIKRTGRQSMRVFVAMYFHGSTDKLYGDAIEPAILKAGYDPLRIDRHEHVNRIDDEIIGQIKRSRFMVADFTGQRHGVYFEAGMMQGLGRNVIWMCDKKEIEEDALHFDVRQFNFVTYESVDEAHTRLYRRILAIEGEGPKAHK